MNNTSKNVIKIHSLEEIYEQMGIIFKNHEKYIIYIFKEYEKNYIDEYYKIYKLK
tara:strand:- start:278 stop:442 length:165 start_codon:yes stop_codon:yes gene_type:complete